MQPARLTIYGEFWDSYLYRGRLYLWSMCGSLKVHDWDVVVEGLSRPETRLALSCAFSRSDLLYRHDEWNVVFDDPHVRAILVEKLAALPANTAVEQALLGRSRMSEQESPFSDLHADLAIHYGTAYALTDSGLFAAGVHKPRKNRTMVARKAQKLWDGKCLSVRAAHRTLALAAGSDGVFEHSLDAGAEPVLVHSGPSTMVDWAYASIYAGSEHGGGCLIGYGWTQPEFKTDPPRRVRVGEFTADEIFGADTAGMTWGSQDKLYLLRGQSIRPVRFTQSRLGRGGLTAQLPAFETLGDVSIGAATPLGLDMTPVSVGAACFGTVIEYQHGVAVVQSDGSFTYAPGAVVRWRVFPKSERYENQLHLLYDDRVEILSFNGDYFVDQNVKRIGSRYRRVKEPPGPAASRDRVGGGEFDEINYLDPDLPSPDPGDDIPF